MKLLKAMSFSSACLSATALLTLAAALQGCAPSRTLVLELRSDETHEPLAHARVRMHFHYFLRVQGAPPEFEFETDAEGRVVANVVLYQSSFAFVIMQGNEWRCLIGSSADKVKSGRACQWSRMDCLRDGQYQDVSCRFWFAGMPGEPPDRPRNVVPMDAKPVPAIISARAGQAPDA